MEKGVKGVSVAVAGLVVVIAMMGIGTNGQGANMASSTTFWTLSKDDKLMWIAEYLANHDAMSKQFLKIAESLRWLEQGTNGDPLGDNLMPAVLDALPDVFSSDVFKGVFFMAFDEIRRVAQLDAVTQQLLFNQTVEKMRPYNVDVYSETFNDTFSKLSTQYIMNQANWPRAVRRLLMGYGARGVLAKDKTIPEHAQVNDQCYNDTMDFLDAVIGAKVDTNYSGPGPEPLDLKSFPWALRMLDSYGKPSGGIMKGAVHYVGSYDECYTVHAYTPRNDSLLFGGKPHDHDTEFDTRFCRVTFDLPSSIADSFGVDTRGITLRLHWGMCFPDTCHGNDVSNMFHLGMLRSQNISVHSVYCIEEEDVGDDSSAIVAIAILVLLGGTVVLCTLIEAAVKFYHNNIEEAGSSSHSSIEDTVFENANAGPSVSYDNAAFQPSDEKEKGIPPNYVPYNEGSSDVKQGLPGSDMVNTSNGNGIAKRSSPPPSYTAKARNGSDKAPIPKLVQAFSVLTNMPKILSGKKSANSIHCLHGIRFFSMLWIVLGHTYNYGVISVIDNPTTVNLVDADTIFHRFTFQGIMAAGFAVDTFFLLSALLVTYLTLKELAKGKNGCMYWVVFYVHRFWRLTPLYMIVLMTFACLHTFLGGGPLWPETLDTAANCKDYWWTNFLYVNNLVHVDDQCMGWTWYLANDMQFYWISPFIIISMFLIAPLGLALAIGLMCLGIACAFYFEQKHGGDMFSMHEDNGYWNEVYITPWCRVAPYAVGMILGYILFKVKKTTLKLSTTVVGWLVCWGVGLTLCYVTYTKNQTGGEDWTIWGYAFFESLGRPAWAACVAWIIFACHNNRGGWINSILSWEGFLPVSRLTYAAYLVHPIVMMLHAFSKKSLIYIDDYDMAYLYMGHVVTSFLTAFFFSLVAEAPALALEKIVLRKH